MHESLYEFVSCYSCSFVLCHFARISFAGVREYDTREFDFVISLIAAGVIVRSFAICSRWNKCSQENSHFSDPSFSESLVVPFQTASRLSIRNEETRFTPATCNITRRAPSLPPHFKLRCSRLIRFGSEFDAARSFTRARILRSHRHVFLITDEEKSSLYDRKA